VSGMPGAADPSSDTAEPRTVSLSGVGPRWDGVDLGALLAAAAPS